MPVYEYCCRKGHTYEKTESFSAPSIQKCIVCRGRARRQISMPAVIFKGSGFYSTDNRGSGPNSGRTASSDSDSTPAAPKSDNGHSHGADGHSHPPKADTKTEASVD